MEVNTSQFISLAN